MLFGNQELFKNLKLQMHTDPLSVYKGHRRQAMFFVSRVS